MRINWARINWVNTVFLIVSPMVVAIGVPLHVLEKGWDIRLLLLFGVACWFTSLSITGGYHRLFSHRSYEARPWFKFLYLVFGAAALQGSALKWSTDHRRHHRYVDTDKDPYSIQKGFWYAHMGWVFLNEEKEYEGKFAPDLEKDPLVMWQHKHYLLLAVIVGFVLPTLVGWAFGSAFGGLLWGGFARVVITHHCTFFINSLCHYLGTQPYGDRTTARDSMIMAFLTYGEGYHNFHHRFQADYRNGIRWYQWDPTKWLIWLGSVFGQTWDLKRVQDTEILKARVLAEENRLRLKGLPDERIAEFRARLLAAQERWKELKESYVQMRLSLREKKDNRLVTLRTEMELARMEFKAALAQWRFLLNKATA